MASITTDKWWNICACMGSCLQPAANRKSSLGGRMVLLPVGSIASAVERDLGEDKFGSQPALGEVSGDSLLCPLCRDFWIQKHQHRRARSAESSTENARFAG